MSGHSKWASIKHKKAAMDAKRGKTFTRYIKEITLAAKMGGGDADANPRLRQAIDGAKSVNMPSDNIKKAILRGTGELEGVNYEEMNYEGYGPGGIALLVETVTDNKNRTVADIRHVFTKYNGNLGEQGCVSWMFSKKGLVIIARDVVEEDDLMELALENGAEDMKVEEFNYEIITLVEDFEPVVSAIKSRDIPMISAEISMIPSTYVKLEGKQAEQMLKLMEKIEELDDIQNVWANFDISDEEIDKYHNN